MNSAPATKPPEGCRSYTDSTCLPAGSIVITTSASVDRLGALATMLTPLCFARLSTMLATRSKP